MYEDCNSEMAILVILVNIISCMTASLQSLYNDIPFKQNLIYVEVWHKILSAVSRIYENNTDMAQIPFMVIFTTENVWIEIGSCLYNV